MENRILIIGGAGFLGCNLARRCLTQPGNHVTVMDALEAHLHPSIKDLKEIWNQITFVRGDVRDETLLSQLVRDQQIIFNCAAQTSHPLSIQHPLLDADINCLGNLKLLEAIRLVNPDAVVVFPSSSTVIGMADGAAVSEDHAEKPLDIYSANKGVAEKYYHIYHVLHDLKTIVLRFANLYGPYGKGYPEFGFINYFIHLANNGKEIKIYGSGEQIRNVMYAEDAVDIMYRAAFAPALHGKTYFATGDEHLSVLKIAEKIVDIFCKGEIVHTEWPEQRARAEIHSVRFTSERLYNVMKWRPKYRLEDGLLKTKKTIERNCTK